MAARNDRYATARQVLIVGILLAIPFSCLLAKAILLGMEHRSGFRADQGDVRVPIPV